MTPSLRPPFLFYNVRTSLFLSHQNRKGPHGLGFYQPLGLQACWWRPRSLHRLLRPNSLESLNGRVGLPHSRGHRGGHKVSFSCVPAAFSSLERCEIPKLQGSGDGRERLGGDRRVFKGKLWRGPRPPDEEVGAVRGLLLRGLAL